jgi:hypothetical protein
MTMVLDEVLDVETAARPADTRAAISYLIASDATAISIIENENSCAFRAGSKPDARAAAIYWLPEGKARVVLKAARKLAGRSPDISGAGAALIELRPMRGQR